MEVKPRTIIINNGIRMVQFSVSRHSILIFSLLRCVVIAQSFLKRIALHITNFLKQVHLQLKEILQLTPLFRLLYVRSYRLPVYSYQNLNSSPSFLLYQSASQSIMHMSLFVIILDKFINIYNFELQTLFKKQFTHLLIL